MARKSFANSEQWLQIAASVLIAAGLTVLLIIGLRRANELQSESAALQLASELSSRPQIIRSELTLIQHGLETTNYVGDSLRNLTAIRAEGNQAFQQMQQQLRRAALADDPAVATPLSAAWNNWQTLDRQLEGFNKN